MVMREEVSGKFYYGMWALDMNSDDMEGGIVYEDENGNLIMYNPNDEMMEGDEDEYHEDDEDGGHHR